MGYHSEVGYVIRGKKEEIIPILMAYRLTYAKPESAKGALDECTYSTTGNLITIKFSNCDCKWYDGYGDVDSHNALFEAFRTAAETDNSTIDGCFVRIGEDDTDIVSSSYGTEPYDLVRIVRSIEFNVDAEDNLEEVLK
jgi:hypothetical protein